MSGSRPADQRNGEHTQAHDRPSVTVDLTLLTVSAGRLRALLMRRDREPYEGHWALPGGSVGIDETLGQAARRILQDKARLADAFIEQLYTFGALHRDPRARVITVAYCALVESRRIEAALAASDGLMLVDITVPWPGEAGGAVQIRSAVGQALPLAFDHSGILGMAVKRLRGKLANSPVGFELLPERFTLRQLQEVHEAILGTRLNKPAFRRRMLDKGVLQATGQRESGTTFRPAELYRVIDRVRAVTIEEVG